MNTYSRFGVADHLVLRHLRAGLATERSATADVLADLAEVDARRLYAPEGYSSLYLFCVDGLHLSEDAAYKRIQAARVAREHPAIFGAVADGRLHLSAVVLLAPHLTRETSDDLIAAAAHKSKAQIELLLAQRFPQPDLVTCVQAIPRAPLAPTRPLSPEPACEQALQLAPGQVGMTLPQQVAPPAPRAKVAPLAPERYALQVTLGQETHDKLRYAQALLGHAMPSGDIAGVLDRALDTLIAKLEQRKFAASSRTRPMRRRRGGDPRYVPTAVRREVWQRDQGQCTFVSEKGHRCEARTRLEFDHVDPVARGGQASAANLRLRCRAHNQYAAECAFGAGFMARKRREARVRKEAGQAAMQALEAPGARGRDGADMARENDVVPWLRQLGIRAEEARHAAALCDALPDASLEERVRYALRNLAPRSAQRAHGS